MERQALSREDAEANQQITETTWSSGARPLPNPRKVVAAVVSDAALRVIDTGAAIRISLGDARLATYTYRDASSSASAQTTASGTEAVRAPRPIWQFWDAQGRELTDRFPADHPWHEGLSLAIAHVGNTNFWGGPTYQPGTAEREAGYQQLENLGSQAHQALSVETSTPGSANSAVHITQELEWLDERVLPMLSEVRRMTLAVEDTQHWRLTWRSTLRNLTKGPVRLGSPATNGRSGAGYGGIFLRLAADYRDGILMDADGNRGESVAEGRASWLRQDSTDASRPSIRLSSAATQPTWFARTAEYPGLGPAPLAETETTLAPGDAVELDFEMTVTQAVLSQDASTQAPEVTR